ncbi:MAG: hypothetical protein AAF351_10030 [Pseudomonadota bacterium]
MTTRNKQRLLWVERYYPIDTRSSRIVETLRNSGLFDVYVCAWNRGEDKLEFPDNYRVLHTPMGYKRLVRKTLGLPKYRRFVKQTIQSLEPDVIGCSFWDMAAIVASIPNLPSRNVYDVIDLPGGSLPMFRFARFIERVSIRRFDQVTLSSRFFNSFYRFLDTTPVLVENLPAFPPRISGADADPLESRPIAFVGSVRHLETLRPVIDYCAQTKRDFAVFGDGPDLPQLRNEYGSSPFVQAYGGYTYDELPSIYGQISTVWAAYPTSEINVRYAISNKFFESIFFQIPGVFSSGTAIGEYVAENHLGYCVDAEDPKDVARLVETIFEDTALRKKLRQNIANYRAENAIHWNEVEARIIDTFRP